MMYIHTGDLPEFRFTENGPSTPGDDWVLSFRRALRW
jgi:hypothetical protein